MKNKNLIVGIVVVVAIFVLAVHFGYINIAGLHIGRDSDRPDTPNPSAEIDLNLSDFEIFGILETIAGRQLSYDNVQPYIGALHMRVYARDDMAAQQLLQWFEAKYAQDNWTSHGVLPQASSNWVGYHEAWTAGTNARSVSVGEGAAVSQAFGHDTVYLIAYGPATTYWQFWNAMR